MNPIQEKLVKAVQDEFERVKRLIEKQLVGQPEYLKNINAAQNALRTCIEAALNKMLPYSGELLIELAIRLASYSISAAPIEDQEVLVAQFMAVFADAHMRRISEGKRISSEWRMADGRAEPNFPADRQS